MAVPAPQLVGPDGPTANQAVPPRPANQQQPAIPSEPAAAWADPSISVPLPALLEASAAFPKQNLPRIGADGRLPRRAYARPAAPPDGRPRIAVILAGVGQSEADSLDLIAKLPGPVTLAVSPYTRASDAIVDAARSKGHEFWLSVPMEPERSVDDAGPRALLRSASPDENRLNLEWSLSRFDGYAGVTGAADNGMRGERFMAQTSSFNLMLDELARRGLMFVDPRPGTVRLNPITPPPSMPVRAVDIVLDDPPARAEIQAKIAAAERYARLTGSALVLAGPPRPVTVDFIATWARTMEERGLSLVPASALVEPARHE